MNILKVEQGSLEWLKARAGMVTASRIPDVCAKIKSGEAASRRDYKAQVVAEILTGLPMESGFMNDAMRWGTEQEPIARASYEVQTGFIVDQVGMVIHPTIPLSAASPDGLVGDDGLVEIKCPNTATHLDTLLSQNVPTKYANYQIQWQMACTGAEWCDFVSFDPRLPEHLQLFVKRVPRDKDRIAEIETEVLAFLAEVQDILNRLPKAEVPADIVDGFGSHDA